MFMAMSFIAATVSHPGRSAGSHPFFLACSQYTRFVRWISSHALSWAARRSGVRGEVAQVVADVGHGFLLGFVGVVAAHRRSGAPAGGADPKIPAVGANVGWAWETGSHE